MLWAITIGASLAGHAKSRPSGESPGTQLLNDDKHNPLMKQLPCVVVHVRRRGVIKWEGWTAK